MASFFFLLVIYFKMTFFFYLFIFFICGGFCHTLKWNSQGFTCVPHPNTPTHHPHHPIPRGFPSAPGPSTCLMHPTWAGDLFLFFFCFLHSMSRLEEREDGLGEEGKCHRASWSHWYDHRHGVQTFSSHAVDVTEYGKIIVLKSMLFKLSISVSIAIFTAIAKKNDKQANEINSPISVIQYLSE